METFWTTNFEQHHCQVKAAVDTFGSIFWNIWVAFITTSGHSGKNNRSTKEMPQWLSLQCKFILRVGRDNYGVRGNRSFRSESQIIYENLAVVLKY